MNDTEPTVDLDNMSVEELVHLRQAISRRLKTVDIALNRRPSTIQKIAVGYGLFDQDKEYRITRVAKDLFVKLGGDEYAKMITGPFFAERSERTRPSADLEYYVLPKLEATDPIFIAVIEQLPHETSFAPDENDVLNRWIVHTETVSAGYRISVRATDDYGMTSCVVPI